MRYQDNLELYVNLSRKELQGLCKKNNLPANRSCTQLAKSLASFFKKKNAHSSLAKEKSGTRVESCFRKSTVPDTEPKEMACPLEGNSKESDICRVSACVKNIGNDDRQHFQTGNQMEASRHIGSRISENVYNSNANAVHPESESPEGLGCSTSEARDEGLRPSTSANIHQIGTGAQLGSECHSLEALTQINHGQKLPNHAVTNSGTRNFAIVPSIQRSGAGCPTRSGFFSPEYRSAEMTPTFQFFVTSEEGINLFVDLDSNPSEWISSLKDEVCVNLENQHHKSTTLHKLTGGFSDFDERMKISPFENIEMSLQSNGVERNSGCITSTLSSVSENCQFEACQLDATVVSSESSVLTASSIPVEISGCLNGNQAVSSSCVTNSIEAHMVFDSSYPGERNVVPQDPLDASFQMKKQNVEASDIFLKPIGNADMLNELSPEETINHEEMEFHPLKIANGDADNVEADNLGSLLTGISEENNLLKSDEIEKIIVASDTANLENDSNACQVSTEGGHAEHLIEVAGQCDRSSSSSQPGVRLALDRPVAGVQTDAGSADHLLNRHTCSVDNSTNMDPVSATDNDLGKSTSVKDKEISVCSPSQDSSYKSSKRSQSLEIHEEFPSKRHHSNSENKSGIMVNLRSVRTSAKETVSDPITHPRRSTRLLSK